MAGLSQCILCKEDNKEVSDNMDVENDRMLDNTKKQGKKNEEKITKDKKVKNSDSVGKKKKQQNQNVTKILCV